MCEPSLEPVLQGRIQMQVPCFRSINPASNYDNHHNADEDFHLPHLPVEIWQAIFSYVDPIARPHLSLVCKRWAQIRFNQCVHEALMDFHKTSLAVFALVNLSRHAVFSLQDSYPLANSSPYAEATERERQELIKEFATIKDSDNLQYVFHKSQEWLANQIPVSIALSRGMFSGGCMLPPNIPHDKKTADLFNRLDLVVRLALIWNSDLNPLCYGSRRIFSKNLLRTRHFSRLAKPYLIDKVPCSPADLLKDQLGDSNRVDAILDYVRLLEYSHATSMVKDRKILQDTLLKKNEMIQSTFMDQLEKSRGHAWPIEACRSYISLLPPGPIQHTLQKDFFLYQLRAYHRTVTYPESYFTFELSALSMEEKQELSVIAAIALALQGRDLSASYFLDCIESLHKRAQIAALLPHLRPTDVSHKPLLEPTDFPSLAPLITSSDEEILQLTLQLHLILEATQESFEPVLDSLACYDYPSFAQVMNLLPKDPHLMISVWVQIFQRGDRSLSHTARWIAQQDSATLVWALYDYAQREPAALDIYYKGLDWVLEQKLFNAPYDDLLATASILYESINYYQHQSKNPDFTGQTRHILGVLFFDQALSWILWNDNLRKLVIQKIHQSPQNTINSIYKHLIGKIEKYDYISKTTRTHLMHALFAQHPQLRHLSAQYYHYDVELLLPTL